MRVRITKLNSVFEGEHPNGIEEGFIIEKDVNKLPYLCIGKTVSLTDEKSHFHTSMVTEVVNETTFKTLNSTYKMEVI